MTPKRFGRFKKLLAYLTLQRVLEFRVGRLFVTLQILLIHKFHIADFTIIIFDAKTRLEMHLHLHHGFTAMIALFMF